MMKSRKIICLNIFAVLLGIYSTMGCYTKTKIDLSKLENKYEISGRWYRGGGYISRYKGVVRAIKIDYLLSIYEDGTYTYRCNDHKSFGTFQVIKDTVIFMSAPNERSRYLYNIAGHELTFTKLDSHEVKTCTIMKKNDAFSGSWHYK